jgi:hypothetical protein
MTTETTIRVELSFFGVDLHPEAITRGLKIAPTSTWHKAEMNKAARRLEDESGWSFSLEETHSLSVEDEINKLLPTLKYRR